MNARFMSLCLLLEAFSPSCPPQRTNSEIPVLSSPLRVTDVKALHILDNPSHPLPTCLSPLSTPLRVLLARQPLRDCCLQYP
jgi:hypothetical protein